jgi:hypothetical protein
MCAEKGYNMTGRDHIIAFDTKRGVWWKSFMLHGMK